MALSGDILKTAILSEIEAQKQPATVSIIDKNGQPSTYRTSTNEVLTTDQLIEIIANKVVEHIKTYGQISGVPVGAIVCVIPTPGPTSLAITGGQLDMPPMSIK